MLQYFDSLYSRKLPVAYNTPNYIYDDIQRNLPLQNLNLIFEIDQDSLVKTKPSSRTLDEKSIDKVNTYIDQTKRSTVIMKVAEKKVIELNSKSTGSEMEEEFICRWKNCSMVFYKLDQLAAHVTDTHAVASNQGLYHCKWDGCPRSERGFNARYKMLVHVRTHTKEKPHQCLLCDKSFSRAENLKIHTRSHSGEKPYICPVEGCNKAYSNSSDRFKHTRTHSTEKPYVCKIPGCQKRYTDPSSLRKHVKTYKHNMCMEINFQTDSDKTLQVDNKTNIIQDGLYTPYNSQCMSSYSANERPDYFINHGPTHNICGSLNGHFRQIFVSYNKPFKSLSPTYWMNEETSPLLIDNMNIDSPLDLTITREKR